MTLVYFSNYNTSVFNSQVIFYLNHLAKSFSFKNLYLFIGISSPKEKKKIPIELIDSNIKVIYFKRYPDYPIIEYLNIFSLRKVLISSQLSDQKLIFHVRTEMLGYYVLRASRSLKNSAKILVDIRGALYDEIKIYYSNILVKKLKIFLLKKVHKYISKNNIQLTCVSNELKKYLISKYRYDTDIIDVNPCPYSDFFDFNLQQRIRIRKKLNIRQDELVVVFSTGSGGKWQNSDLIINYLSTIPTIKILNLSNKNVERDNVLNFFVPFKEMPQYLSSADVAIIIRENNLVNKVASPVKFSEYLACGLPVIANEGVGVISDILSSYNIGTLINSIDQIDEDLIKMTYKIARESVKEVAKRYFSIDNVSSSYLSLYNKMLK